jgi:hypothetical protein
VFGVKCTALTDAADAFRTLVANATEAFVAQLDRTFALHRVPCRGASASLPVWLICLRRRRACLLTPALVRTHTTRCGKHTSIPDGCVHSALLTLHRRCCPSLRRRRRVQLRQTAVQRIKHSNTERALLSIRQQTPNVSAVSTIQAPLSLCMLCGAARTAAVRSEFTKAFTKAWTTGAVPAHALPSCVCVAHGLFRYCTALSK